MSDQRVLQSQTERNIQRLRSATAVAYLVGFSLLAITVGLSFWRVQAAHVQLERVMTLHDLKLNLITETQIASHRLADAVQLLILERDPIRQDDIHETYLKSGFQVGDARNRIRSLLTGDEEKAVFAAQDAIVSQVVDLHQVIANLARNGQHEAARTIFMDSAARLHAAGHETFQTLRELQTRAAGLAIKTANTRYHVTQRDSMIAILISLFVSIGIGLLMHRASGRIGSRLRAKVSDLRRMALHDGLTGMLNRTAVTQYIEQQLNKTGSFAVFYMDLDDFKQVNDEHGHDRGDHFLMMAAGRIRGRMRGVDIVARLGGDEFVAVLEGIGEIEECEHVARHIIQAFEPPLVHGDIAVQVGISIGVAIAPANGRSATQILNVADRAMYRAKHRGPNSFEIQGQPVHLTLHDSASG